MLLVSRFKVVRRRARVIHVVATTLALAITPIITLVLAAWWVVPIVGGPDFNVAGIFWSFRRFFVRFFSGHALRPFTLRSVSGARF